MWKKRLLRFSKWFFGILLGLILLISLILYMYKDEICDIVIGKVNTYLNTEVEVSEVDLTFWSTFPNLSVDFNNVFIQDPYEEATERDTLFASEQVRLKFNPFDIWRENYTVKSIEVSPGTLQLKVNGEGEENYNIVKSKEDTVEQAPVDLNLELIEFENFRLSYDNRMTDQLYRTHLKNMTLNGALSESVFSTTASTNMKILEARSGKVTLLKNQPARLSIQVNVNSDSSTVEIPPSTIYISELPFDFNGMVDSLGYDFHVKGKNIAIADAASRFSVEQSAQVKKLEGTGYLLFDLNVNGKNNNASPATIQCNFGVDNGFLKDPSSQLSLQKLHLEGEYSNLGGKAKEFLALRNVSFNTKGGPFAGNLMLTKFDAPHLDGSADGTIDLTILHAIFHIPVVEEMNGSMKIHSDFIVNGVLREDESMDYNIQKCEGEVDLMEVDVKLKDDQRRFSNLNGRVYLRNNEAGLKDITLNLGKSDFEINGVFKDVVNYFKGTGSLISDLDVHSNRISISDLGSTTKDEKEDLQRVFMLPEDIRGTAFLDVGRMDYEGHVFSQLKGNMTINGRVINFPQISVNNGGADIRGSLNIEERTPEYFYLKSNLVSKNMRFKPLFKEWNNFQQDVIKSYNIDGVAQVSLNLEAPFDLRGGIISSGIMATIGLQIDNGRLKNVSAFKSITESLRETSSARMIIGKNNINSFEKKLLDLKFEQLSNTLIIRNGVITIPQMSISSSALDIEVSGKHTFENKIDYRFGFRLQDIKEKKTSEFGEIIDDGTGVRVYVRMFGSMDDPSVEWDGESRKEQARKNREEEKETVRSMFRSEFGLFKNDSTVQEYIPNKVPEEELIIEFNTKDTIEEVFDEHEPLFKRKKKDRPQLRKWELEKKKEKEESVEFDFD
ncbi:MAG: AsmA-like C-terminal region-containing protein [Crocinitomicaceae bacterium]